MKLDYKLFPTLVFAACAFSSVASAQNTYINDFGAGNWYSDDTRNDEGTSLIGENSTRGGGGTSVDDIAIRSYLSFTSDFAGAATSNYGLGALRIWSGGNNKAKSTLSMVDTTGGFAAASSMLSSDFYTTYRAYNEPSPTSRSVALRFGIQSTEWASSQEGYTATRTGEEAWDMILVYNDPNTPNAWTQHTVSATEGTWSLYFQAGMSYFGSRPTEKKTLQEWMNDATYGNLLFGSGAVISSVQLGLGSDAKTNNSYVDFLQSNLLNGGRAMNFVDASVAVSSGTVASGANDMTSSSNAVIQLDTGGSADAQVSVGNTGVNGEKTIVEVTPGATVVVESLEVAAGGVLAGGGKIESSTGVTVSNGGVHAPGFSPGVQVLAADYTNSSALEIEVSGLLEATGNDESPVNGKFDQLLITGEVDLSDLTLTVVAYNSFMPEVGDTFNILYFTDDTPELDNLTLLVNGFSQPVTFQINTLLDGSGSFLGQADLNYLQLEVIAIPEPSTYGMLLVGGAIGFSLVRRRKKALVSRT